MFFVSHACFFVAVNQLDLWLPRPTQSRSDQLIAPHGTAGVAAMYGVAEGTARNVAGIRGALAGTAPWQRSFLRGTVVFQELVLISLLSNG